MSKKSLICTLVACFVIIAAQSSMADESAAGVMANIVIKLNHFPSDADKATLTGIIESEDSSEDEITIATAILNIAHQVNASDKESLGEIIADDSVSAEMRDLANAVLNVDHKASDADVAKLEMIASKS